MPAYDVVVIGGGNLGLWTAYQLGRRKFNRVAVCERGWMGNGATSRSAGVVRQQGGSETAAQLGKLSRQLYIELGKGLGLDSGFRETGYYIVAETDKEKKDFLSLLDVRRKAGVENEWLEPDEGRRQFPMLNWDRLVGATYTPNDGYVHPPIAARNATYAAMRWEKVELLEMCEVCGIDQTGDRYLVETTRGVLEAERVVNAGGPRGTSKLGRMLDVEIPVKAVRHQIITYPTVAGRHERSFPMFFAVGKGYYVRPEEQGALLGLSNPLDEPDTSERYQIDFDWAYYEKMRRDWESMFPGLKRQPISKAWAASIDYTPDHLPIIDEPKEGFYILAAGGHGMMWGPALGYKMAELISEGRISDIASKDIELARFKREHTAGDVKDTIALPFPTS